MSFRIHFHDLEPSTFLHGKCESLNQSLRDEFPEVQRCEVTLSQVGEEHTAQVHVTGKDIDLASSASAKMTREAASEAFDRVRKQLRKHHDKQIFNRRREARQS